MKSKNIIYIFFLFIIIILLLIFNIQLKFINSNSIASLAFYLCSDDASEITGSSMNIDGGWTSQ